MQNNPTTQSARHDGYIRRHCHDVRNCLAAMDLQTILLQRTASKPGENSQIATIRSLIGCLEELQLRLGLRFRIQSPATISLNAIFEQCQARHRVTSVDKDVAWALAGGDGFLLADGEALSILIVEIADRFFSFGGGTIKAFAHGGNACFQMQRSCDHELANRQAGMDAEVNDELAAIAARFGGALVCGPGGLDLLVTFPQVPVDATGTAER